MGVPGASRLFLLLLCIALWLCGLCVQTLWVVAYLWWSRTAATFIFIIVLIFFVILVPALHKKCFRIHTQFFWLFMGVAVLWTLAVGLGAGIPAKAFSRWKGIQSWTEYPGPVTLQQARDSILDVTTPYDSFRFNGAVVVDTDALEQDSLVNPDSQSGDSYTYYCMGPLFPKGSGPWSNGTEVLAYAGCISQDIPCNSPDINACMGTLQYPLQGAVVFSKTHDSFSSSDQDMLDRVVEKIQLKHGLTPAMPLVTLSMFETLPAASEAWSDAVSLTLILNLVCWPLWWLLCLILILRAGLRSAPPLLSSSSSSKFQPYERL